MAIIMKTKGFMVRMRPSRVPLVGELRAVKCAT